MTTIWIADGRSRDRHLGVGVEVGDEGIDGAGLDRRVVVENEVILGCALLEQPVVVGAKAAAIGLLDELDGRERLAHCCAGAVLGGVIEHQKLAGFAGTTGSCQGSQRLEQEGAIAVRDDGDGEPCAHRSRPR